MKIFEATLTGGQITADKGIVFDCPVLGNGGDSDGFLIMAEDKLVYLPKRSPDLEKTLEYISSALTTIATGVYKANAGGSITSDTFATDLAELKNKVDELKGALK